MSYLKFFKDITKNNVDIAGGKGASLGEMTNANIPIPPGFVILSTAFDQFLKETNLNAEIVARLKEVNPEDTNSIDHISAVIRDAIHDHSMPNDLQEEIIVAFKQLGSEFVAVRSSATAEDSSIASWAGELETYLNTNQENVIEHVKKCWSSLFTPRAIFYRHEKNLIDHYVSVAVVIQKMIQSEISGIAFTVHPVTEDPNQMIIEAGYGLGEAIVSGTITPDSYIVNKSGMSILDINVSTQNKKLIKNTNTRPNTTTKTAPVSEESSYNSNKWVSLSENEGNRQKLTGKQIVEVAKTFVAIEKHYGFPCDIEWAMESGHLYITQSRPITTLKKKN